MWHGDPVVLFQVLIEPGGSHFPRSFIRRDRQWTHAAMREDCVAVSVGIPQAALRSVERRESASDLKQIHEFLILPPGEFLVVSGLMVGGSDVVEPRHIERITIYFEQRAIIFKVLRYVRVAVHIAAIDLVLLAVG